MTRFYPSDEDLSLGTPAFHPSDEDLSLGTPASREGTQLFAALDGLGAAGGSELAGLRACRAYSMPRTFTITRLGRWPSNSA
jgi:hypothetical protein